MEKLMYKPIICLRCGAKFTEGQGEPLIEIKGDEIHAYPGGLAGGEITCSTCGEIHSFRVYQNKLTLQLRSIPLNYSGVKEKIFGPHGN